MFELFRHTDSTNASQGISRRVSSACLAIALFFGLSIAPSSAYADVFLTDIVMDQTVEQRNLDISRCPNIFCEYASVIDQDGRIIFERNGNAPTKIASITKLMTAIVAIENMDLQDRLTVSASAAGIGESTANLEEGDTLTLENALYGMLIPSGNDAAITVMEGVGARLIADGKTQETDPQAAFIKAMNDKAKELGCKDTLFTNCHGLDYDEYASDQHSTANDVALICRYFMQNETLAHIVGVGNSWITVYRHGSPLDIDIETTNQLFDIYQPCTGVKTGSTDAAGYCFVGAATSGKSTFYAVALNDEDPSQRFFDARDMLNWGFEHRIEYKLVQSTVTDQMVVNGTTKRVPVVADVAHADWIDQTFHATVENPDQTIIVYDLEGNVSQEVTFDEITSDVHVGDKVGTITYFQHNQEIARINMISCEDVEAPNMFQRIGIWFERLWKQFNDEPTVAESVVYNQTPLLNNKAGA